MNFDYNKLDTETREYWITGGILSSIKMIHSDKEIIMCKSGRTIEGYLYYPCRIQMPRFVPPIGVNCVYGLIDPRDSSLYYIGCTNQFPKRIPQHIRNTHRNQSRTTCFGRPWGTYHFNKRKVEIYDAGLNTIATVIALYEDYDDALYTEHYLLRKFGEHLLNKVQYLEDKHV